MMPAPTVLQREHQPMATVPQQPFFGCLRIARHAAGCAGFPQRLSGEWQENGDFPGEKASRTL